MSERDIRNRLRIQRVNRDKGWRELLDTPTGREALWELYAKCREGGAVLPKTADGDVASGMVIEMAARHTIAQWIENRCMLVDHRNWLIMLAENDRPLDDGRAQDKADEQAMAQSEAQ